MQISEILPTSRKFVFGPDEGEEKIYALTVTVHYDIPMLTLNTIIGEINVFLGKKGDPAKLLANMSKDDVLKAMNCRKNINFMRSYAETSLSLNAICSKFNIVNNVLSLAYEEMMRTYGSYTDEYAYRSLIHVIAQHEELKQYAHEIIVTIEDYQEFYVLMAELIINQLLPILMKTNPINLDNGVAIKYQ